MRQRTLEILEYPKIIESLEQLTASALGRSLCQALEPAVNWEQIQEQMAETTDAVSVLLQKGEPPLQGLHTISPGLKRARTGSSLNALQLSQIASFLGAVRRVRSFAPTADRPALDPRDGGHDGQQASAQNRFAQKMLALKPCEALERLLNRSLLGEEVLDTASPELAAIRRKLRQAQEKVRAILETLVKNQGQALQDQLVTLRGSRYVLPVKESHRGQIPGLVHDRSGTGQTLFIEPLQVVEANNKIRELEADEREEIRQILQALTEAVVAQRDLLLENEAGLAQIDFLTAKARLALRQKAQPPRLNQDGRIRLVEARHPLLDPQKAVPISLHWGDQASTLLITGPNTGGKTVALKTVGLLTLMAQSGLHIPASEATDLSVFEEIYVDLGDEQSIEQNLSTFSSHMKNLVDMTEQARPGCLILSDEMGSGTDPLEGAALAITLLEDWRTKGARILATTHYRELKLYALSTEGVENACCELDPQTFKPTYRILMGAVGTSHAFAISKRLGLPEHLITAAQQRLQQQDVDFEALLAELTHQRLELTKTLEAAEQERALLAQTRADLAAQKQVLETKRADWVAKIREEVRSQYAEGVAEMDHWLKSLKSLVQEEQSKALQAWTDKRRKLGEAYHQVEAEIGRSTLQALQSTDSGDPTVSLIVGETYTATALGLTGRLVTLPDAKGQCKLSTGTLQVNVPAATLTRAAEQTEPKAQNLKDKSAFYREKARSRRGGRTAPTMATAQLPLELMLLGQTTLDALQHLDQHLDQAQMVGIHEVRIVHGKGTGALRKAIHQALKRDKRVDSFRLAGYGEGDTGVTIATLK